MILTVEKLNFNNSKDLHGNKRKQNDQQKLKKINWIEVSKIVGNRNPRQCEEKYRRLWASAKPQSEDQTKNFWSIEDENKLFQLVKTYGLQWQMFEDYFQKRSWLQIKQKYYNDLRRKPQFGQQKIEINTISENSENSEKTKSDNVLILAEDQLFLSKYASNYRIKNQNIPILSQ